MYIHGEWPATRANPVYGGFDLSVGMCTCACYRVDEIGSTCCFNSFLLKKHFKLFIYFAFIFFSGLPKGFKDYMKVSQYSSE